MTIALLSNFVGGSIGAQPTTTTEPMFSSAGGTQSNMVYSAALGTASGQSVTVTNARSLIWTTPGPHWRIGMWVKRVSGTISAGQAMLAVRNSTTNVGDAFLRNQSGGQFALRQGAGGTTYNGQTTTVINNGDLWWIEFEYDSNGTTHSVELGLWEPGNTTATANSTFTGTVASAVDNVTFFNPTGITGLTMQFADLYKSDGEQIRQGASPGTLTFASNLNSDADTIRAAVKVAAATTVRLEVAPAAGGSTVAGSNATPDGASYAQLSATGLTANTNYNWTIYVDDTSRATGSCRTMPAAGSAASFTFGWGSCYDTNTSGAFALMAARSPIFFAMVGDWGYQYISGGANGNTSPTDVATVRTHREAVLAAAIPQGFWTGRSIHYTYSDCDGAGANSDSTTGGHATGAVQAAYRQQFAHPILPLADCGARSWVIGRVRFIQTDETVLASAKAATDNSSKTKLGTTQKAWFKAEIDAAVAAGQAVVWFGDGPWITPTGNGSSNEWAFYNTERTELGTYITTSGVRMIRLHGDAHTLFNDNGANNNWGAFPTACGAPIHTTAQTYGYTISGSRWPTATTNGSRHYGIVDVADNGTTITFTIHGWSSTVAAPTEVERFTETVVYTVTTPAPAGEARATIMRRGDGRRGTVTSKARRVIS